MSPSTPRLAGTWGCQLISYIVCVFFYGIVVILLGQYFKSQSQKDSVYVRLIVGLLWILSTLHTVFFGHVIYRSFVTSFGDLLVLDDINFSIIAALMTTFLTMFVTQSFFVSRVWIITKHNPHYAVPMVLLILIGIGLGFVQIIILARAKKFSLLTPIIVKIAGGQYAAVVACDALITFVLCYVLHNSKSEIRKLDSVTDKFIVYAINRGSVSSVNAVIVLALFCAFPRKFYFIIPLGAGGHFNAISVMSLLTYRQKLQTLSNRVDTFSRYPLPNQYSEPFHFNSDGVFKLKSVITWRDDYQAFDSNAMVRKSSV